MSWGMYIIDCEPVEVLKKKDGFKAEKCSRGTHITAACWGINGRQQNFTWASNQQWKASGQLHSRNMILELSLPLLKGRCRFTHPLCQVTVGRACIPEGQFCWWDRFYCQRQNQRLQWQLAPFSLSLQHRHFTEAWFAKQCYHTAISAVKRKSALFPIQKWHPGL